METRENGKSKTIRRYTFEHKNKDHILINCILNFSLTVWTANIRWTKSRSVTSSSLRIIRFEYKYRSERVKSNRKRDCHSKNRVLCVVTWRPWALGWKKNCLRMSRKKSKWQRIMREIPNWRKLGKLFISECNLCPGHANRRGITGGYGGHISVQVHWCT